MWPFRKSDREKRLDARALEIEEREEALTNHWQEVSQLKAQIAELKRPQTDEGVNAIAAALTATINDYYAIGASSVQNRTDAIHAEIASAIRKVVKGEKAWNEDQIAREFYRKK